MLNQDNIQSPIMKCRINWFIFFVMEVYLEKMMERLNSGELKKMFRNISCIHLIGLMKCGRVEWQEAEATSKDTSIVLIRQEHYCTSEPFNVIPGRSHIDPTLQDNVVIPSDLFQDIFHVGCAINLHSIINSGLIPGGQNLRNRQTEFFLLVDSMDKNQKDLDTIDL